MTHHCKAITYLPKVEAVREGRCTQTIRPLWKRPVDVGDTITFHGWQGKPYRTPWSWRLEVEVIQARHILVSKEGASAPLELVGFTDWNNLDWLAIADGIQPPTGVALGELLNSMYDLSTPKEFQIIRWKVIEKVSKA